MSEWTDPKTGKFLPGNNANPKGRPRREIEQEYVDATVAEVTVDDWRDIVKTAKAHAKAGDASARGFLAQYILGKPTERLAISHSGDDALIDLTDAQIDELLASSSHGPNGNGATPMDTSDGGDDGEH
jgi:hypothetical protein